MALLLTGCGGSGSGTTGATAVATPTAAPAQTPTPTPTPAPPATPPSISAVLNIDLANLPDYQPANLPTYYDTTVSALDNTQSTMRTATALRCWAGCCFTIAN